MTDTLKTLRDYRDALDRQSRLTETIVEDLGYILGYLEIEVKNAQASAWWRGVNDQWKHLPQRARLIEFANPYRDPKKPSDWVQSGVVTMPEEIQPKGSDDD